MHPHAMPSGSVLFSLAQAQEMGVGASLHLRPPGRIRHAYASQVGDVLCTRDDVEKSCYDDIKIWSWRRVRENILQPRDDSNDEEDDVDISEGHLFPWWLLLGYDGRHWAEGLLDRGVINVVLSGRSIRLTLLDGEVNLMDRHNRLEILELER